MTHSAMNNTYRFWIPIEDTDMLKAIETDSNGDYIVQGVMTTDDRDEESDQIDPVGMDCSYFLKKGWIKYEHGNNPNQFIGEPLEIRVGRFTHPTLGKVVNGVFVKGRLFKNRELAQQAVQTIKDLQKSDTNRRMGWSIEGNVQERDPKTGKIVKSILRNVALTMNPINTNTWVEFAKSFASNHELTINCDIEKATDLSDTEEVRTQSLEGNRKKQKEYFMKLLELLHTFLRDHTMNKALQTLFLESNPLEISNYTYHYALSKGFSKEDSVEFSLYIAEKSMDIKTLLKEAQQ